MAEEGEAKEIAPVLAGEMTAEERDKKRKRMIGYGEMLRWKLDDVADHCHALTKARTEAGLLRPLGRLTHRGRDYRGKKELVARALGGLINTIDLIEFDSKRAAEDDRDPDWRQVWLEINQEANIMLKSMELGNTVAIYSCLESLNKFLEKCK